MVKYQSNQSSQNLGESGEKGSTLRLGQHSPLHFPLRQVPIPEQRVRMDIKASRKWWLGACGSFARLGKKKKKCWNFGLPKQLGQNGPGLQKGRNWRDMRLHFCVLFPLRHSWGQKLYIRTSEEPSGRPGKETRGLSKRPTVSGCWDRHWLSQLAEVEGPSKHSRLSVESEKG